MGRASQPGPSRLDCDLGIPNLQAGYTSFRLVLVDTAYAPWKQKYLQRDGCCRIFCLPSTELHPDMMRPSPVYQARTRGPRVPASLPLARLKPPSVVVIRIG